MYGYDRKFIPIFLMPLNGIFMIIFNAQVRMSSGDKKYISTEFISLDQTMKRLPSYMIFRSVCTSNQI